MVTSRTHPVAAIGLPAITQSGVADIRQYDPHGILALCPLPAVYRLHRHTAGPLSKGELIPPIPDSLAKAIFNTLQLVVTSSFHKLRVTCIRI